MATVEQLQCLIQQNQTSLEHLQYVAKGYQIEPIKPMIQNLQTPIEQLQYVIQKSQESLKDFQSEIEGPQMTPKQLQSSIQELQKQYKQLQLLTQILQTPLVEPNYAEILPGLIQQGQKSLERNASLTNNDHSTHPQDQIQKTLVDEYLNSFRLIDQAQTFNNDQTHRANKNENNQNKKTPDSNAKDLNLSKNNNSNSSISRQEELNRINKINSNPSTEINKKDDKIPFINYMKNNLSDKHLNSDQTSSSHNSTKSDGHKDVSDYNDRQ